MGRDDEMETARRGGAPGAPGAPGTPTGSDAGSDAEQRPGAVPLDHVLEADEESFPASDPPAWTTTHSGPPAN